MERVYKIIYADVQQFKGNYDSKIEVVKTHSERINNGLYYSVLNVYNIGQMKPRGTHGKV